MRLSRLSILVMLALSANAYAVTINATDEDLFVYDGNIDATGNRIGINAISGYDVTVTDDEIYVASDLRAVQVQNSTVNLGAKTGNVTVTANTVASNAGETAMGMFVNTLTQEGAAGLGNQGVVNIDGTNISISANSFENQGVAEGIRVQGGLVNIGSDRTERVTISAAGNEDTMALFAFQSQVKIQAKNVEITTNGDYGILAQNNSETSPTPENSSRITIDAENTVITNTSEEGAAIMAFSNGHVDISGNLTVKAAHVIDTRGNAEININQDGRGTVVLDGAIVFETPGSADNSGNVLNSTVNLNLTGEGSSWTGTTMKLYPTTNADNPKYTEVNDFTLTIADGAQWNVTNYEGSLPDGGVLETQAVNDLTLDAGVINTKESTQTVEVENLTVTEKGGTFNAMTTQNEDGSFATAKLEVGTVVAEDSAMTVNYTDINADQITEENAKGLSAVSATGLTTTEHVAEGNIRGAWTRTTDAEGNQTSGYADNTKLESFKGVNASALVQWRNQINHLTKRLGGVRHQSGDIGAWARVYGGEYKWGDTNRVDMQTTTVQVGGDARVGDWIVGGAFSYSDSSYDLDNGDGDGDMYSLAVYGTRMFEKGSYVDFVARYGYIKNDITAGNMGVDFDSNAFSLSVEGGHTYKFMERAYVEPQIEVTYGFAQGDDATASNGVKIEQDDYQNLITRIGFRTGFDFPNEAGTIYAHASYSYDFLGEADGTASQGGLHASLDEDLGGGWVTYGIGGQFRMGESTFAYGELERSTGGDVDNPWAFNIGVRHLF